MRIAIISDIHGNLVALEAVLAHLARDNPEQIVCLGDVAGTGPQPHEATTLLQSLRCPVIMGNGDAWLLDPHEYPSKSEARRRIAAIGHWCAAQLTTTDWEFMRTFQSRLEIPLGDGLTLLCFHGSPQSNLDFIIATTANEDLEQMLGGFAATVMIGGHTHVQMLRRHRDLTIVNAGSVGLPFNRPVDRMRFYPRAEYALVAVDHGSLAVELRRVPFDIDRVLRAAFDRGMPHADWWAETWDPA